MKAKFNGERVKRNAAPCSSQFWGRRLMLIFADFLSAMICVNLRSKIFLRGRASFSKNFF
jgi:hypothetical protein